jgi:hypothetical protein
LDWQSTVDSISFSSCSERLAIAKLTPSQNQNWEFRVMSRPAFALFAQQYFSALLSNFGTVYLNEPVPRDPSLRVYKIPSRSNWGTEVLGVVAGDNPQIMISPEVIAEAELVDVLFEPNEQQSRASLGLLGELLFVSCIIAIISLLQYDLCSIKTLPDHLYETLFFRLSSESCRSL